jgi:hypothetical protein
MEKISRVVVIPIYRLLTERERISLRQCFRVFGTEDICFVTYSELSLSDCYALAKEYGLKVARKNFKKYYFRSVQGYNHLMLTPPHISGI